MNGIRYGAGRGGAGRVVRSESTGSNVQLMRGRTVIDPRLYVPLFLQARRKQVNTGGGGGGGGGRGLTDISISFITINFFHYYK